MAGADFREGGGADGCLQGTVYFYPQKSSARDGWREGIKVNCPRRLRRSLRPENTVARLAAKLAKPA